MLRPLACFRALWRADGPGNSTEKAWSLPHLPLRFRGSSTQIWQVPDLWVHPTCPQTWQDVATHSQLSYTFTIYSLHRFDSSSHKYTDIATISWTAKLLSTTGFSWFFHPHLCVVVIKKQPVWSFLLHIKVNSRPSFLRTPWCLKHVALRPWLTPRPLRPPRPPGRPGASRRGSPWPRRICAPRTPAPAASRPTRCCTSSWTEGWEPNGMEDSSASKCAKRL